MRRFAQIFVVVGLLLQSVVLSPGVYASPPDNPAFERTWARTDGPVASGNAVRTWMWGPEAFTEGMTEPYLESPDLERTVQYFDKSRMEITDPEGDQDALWYVTNGLLATELITGRMQIGDDAFVQLDPAAVNVAGDPDDPNGPTYATFTTLLDRDPAEVGALYTQRLDRNANIVDDPALADRGVTAGHYDEVTGHTVAAPFWEFMNSAGIVYESGRTVEANLFENPFFATGRPITEAYWSTGKVAGTEQDVLMQCFERRCLTYTPENEAGWQVEAGNVGRHYHTWRYESGQQYVVEPVSAVDGGTVSLGDATLEIPAGALAADTLASIAIHNQNLEVPEGYLAVSPLYDLGVAGTPFDGDVTLSLPYDAAAIPDDVTVDDLVVGRWDSGAGEWQLIPGAADRETATISVTTGQLSFWQVFSPVSGSGTTPPAPPTPPTPTPTPPTPPGPPAPPGPPGPTPTPDPDPVTGPPVIDLNGPQEAGTGYAATFKAGEGPVHITSSALAITDPDSVTLVSATVRITNRQDGTQEVLAATTSGTPITASFNVATGTLTLTGTASLAQYEQVLRTVTYDNTADEPATETRSVTFVVSDGTYTSNTAVAQVTIQPREHVNEPPVAEDQSVSATGGVALEITLVATDIDSPALTFQIVDGPDHGTLDSTTPAAACVAAGDGVTCTATVVYTADFDYNGPDAFTFTASDGSLTSDAATVSISVTSASTETSTIEAAPESITADGVSTSTITVQLKEADGTDLTSSGGVVELSTTSGTLSDVTDNDDGTYTATLTAPTTVGTATISGTINGQALDDTATVEFVVGPAARITIVSGDGDTVEVGETHTLEALVTDANDNPIEGYTVAWAVTSGNGTLSAATSATGADGVASIEWTLGTEPGDQTATATAEGLSGSPLTYTVQAIPGLPTQLAIITQPAATAQNGVTLTTQPVIQLRDEYDNPVALSGYLVTATIASGAGTLSGATTVTTQEDGLAIFTGLTITGMAGDYTLEFITTGLDPVTSDTIALSAGAPANLEIAAGDGQTAVAGSAVGVAPAVLVTDVSNNPVPGVSVIFSVASGGGSVTDENATTGADGIAMLGSWTLGTVAGENTLTAAVADLTPVTFTATGIAGPANTIAIESGDGGTVVVGTTRTLEVLVTDENGNPVSGQAVDWAIASGGGSLNVTSSETEADGIASVTWTFGTTSGPQSVTATADGLVGSPLTFNVDSVADEASPGHTTITASPTAILADGIATATITVQLVDQYGNHLDISADTVELETTLGTLSDVTDNEDGTYSATLTSETTLGTATISGTLNGAALTDTATVDFIVGPLAGFVVEAAGGGDIADQVIDAPFNIQITAVDAVGHTVTTFDGTVDITSDGTLSAGGGTTAAFVNGVLASHAVTFSDSGTFTLTATLTGDTISGTSNTFFVDSPPEVVSTTPADAAIDLPTDTTIEIVFSEPVDVTGNWLQVVCDTSGTHDVTGATVTGDAETLTVDFADDFTPGESCTVTVFASQVTDRDGSVALSPLADYSFSFTFDTAPEVTSTSPVDGGVFESAITITFSEPVTLAAGWFELVCTTDTRGPGDATVTGGPTTFTVELTDPLTSGDDCTMTIVASGVMDQDANDPPDTMVANHVFTFSVPVVAVDDSYGATGNIAIALDAQNGLLANDPGVGISVGEVQGAAANVGEWTDTTATGLENARGRVLVNADGSFTYDPPPGYVGDDTFTYRVTSGTTVSELATVTITVDKVDGALMWFVCDACASTNQGTLLNPFTTISRFTTINGSGIAAPQENDLVYIQSGTYDGPDNLTLRKGQRAYGQAVAASSLYTPHENSVAAFAALEAGSAPTLSPAEGNVVTLASDNTLQGVNIVVPSGGTGIFGAPGGAAIGTFTVDAVAISGAGQALNLANGTLAGNFTSITSTGGVNNIYLSTITASGTVSLGSGALSGSSNAAFVVSGGSGNLTYGGSITNTTDRLVSISGRTGGSIELTGDLSSTGAGTGILVQNNPGGTVTFGGASKTFTMSGGNQAVTLVDNPGATVAFTNGGLAIQTATGTGFHATGSGTVIVTGANNTITSNGGVALNVADVTIGTGGLVFQRISANGGSSGIVLNNTGSGAGLTINGDGTPGSGGTIQNMSGNGISLTDTAQVVLNHLNVTNSAGNGIYGNSVSDFTLAHSSVTGSNSDDSEGFEAGIRFDNLWGTSAITNTTVSGTQGDEIRLEQTSGQLTNLTISGGTIGPNLAGDGANGIALTAIGTAAATVTVTGVTISGVQASGFLTAVANTASVNTILTNNTIEDTNIGIDIGIGGSRHDFKIEGNTITGSVLGAINIISDGTSSGASGTGTVDNNTIGSTEAMSGSEAAHGIAVDIRGSANVGLAVRNNVIQQTAGHGIINENRMGSGFTNIAITGNTVSAPGAAGIRVTSRDSWTTCLNISGNTSTGPDGIAGISVRQANTAVFRLHGFTGTGTEAASVEAYLAGRNTSTAGVQTTGNGTIVQYTSATCATP